jgi:superfamily II DNA or RNA helicase
MAPRNGTVKRQLRKTPWIEKISTSTYPALSIDPKKFQDTKFELIILDEFHRIGAPEWKNATDNLLAANPKALVLGTSATNIRFLDQCRDMADEIFDGNAVFGPNLPEAIATRLLPNPTYVTAFYSLDTEIQRAGETINQKSDGPIQRDIMHKQLYKLHSQWSASQHISNIIAKHSTCNARKYIVFCESIEHLNAMESQVCFWMKKAFGTKSNPYIRTRTYVVHSGISEPRNEKEISTFENSDPGDTEIELLFSVDMLNESIHIRGVDGVFLLRKTISPVLYLQQIGRTLACDGSEVPVIFDLVDNGGNIKHANFRSDLAEANASLNKKRRSAGLPMIKPVEAIVHDYVTETSDLINDMLHVFDPWESKFRQLEEFFRSNGHCNVAQRNSSLGKWVNHQRTLKSKGLLCDDKIKRLSVLDFQWNAISDFSEKMISYLKEVYKETGKCLYKTGDPDADRWMESMRRMHRGGSLTSERLEFLESIDFVWNHFEHSWNSKYYLLTQFYHDNGNSNAPKDHPELGRWVRSQRDRANTLSSKRIDMLNKIGFRWR